ncbi:MAG: hypothetical protein ACFFEN_11535 [Candidatus Thorarchaeota archaeon]
MEYSKIFLYEKKNKKVKNWVIETNIGIKSQIFLCLTISLIILSYSFSFDCKVSTFSTGTFLSSSGDFFERHEANSSIPVNTWDLGGISFPNHNNILGRTDHTCNVVFIFFR